jgi:hypothetical protein
LARSTGEGYALYPADGGQPEDVRGIAKDEIPMNWTADGKSIWIRSAQKPISIFRVNLADGQRTLWKEIRPNDPAGILGTPGVLITPDGKVYAYTYRRILSDLYLAQDLR